MREQCPLYEKVVWEEGILRERIFDLETKLSEKDKEIEKYKESASTFKRLSIIRGDIINELSKENRKLREEQVFFTDRERVEKALKLLDAVEEATRDEETSFVF